MISSPDTPDQRRRQSITLDTLRFPQGRLYGRENEVRLLQELYKTVVDRADSARKKKGEEYDGVSKHEDELTKKEIIIVPGCSG